ncbi:3-hydroxyacyl-CoA dehydrogenase [Roseimicrobium gellanilyticum]|uniref:3-hydroxyacyl-CoA dehydrogenase n=1 Tax=Roseimicrobium gellanilyticum TaxID=748857 RepID=A0A366HUH2_9BACT|nr:3-hydroxyacyl-CoA dehydrogenase NAD-binding domain-containing protein [Roseimicrobium gellanilyticum]RBP47926.1 3-hydroxyacyl-CoA dehydrogenase [Roseimicrobium gellanilyticum]
MTESSLSSSSTIPADIKRIGILGAGQMGAAAAVMFRRAGFEVRLWARREEKLRESKVALDAVESFLDEHFGTVDGSGGELHLEPSLVEVDATSDAVLECVVEDMGEKMDLLKQLKSCRQRDALVMTCTSALCISDMAAGSGMEPVLVGAHFWNPPHLIPVVEIIGGKDTPGMQVERAMALMKSVGKIPVKCADVPGFVGNRLMHAMWREALAMVDAGVCSAEDIDRVVKWTFALRLPALGPMENIDLVGVGLVHRVESYLFPHLATNAVPSDALSSRLKGGETGMDAGRGFYDWKERDAKATVVLRDRQIVRQLQFLREQGVFDNPQ